MVVLLLCVVLFCLFDVMITPEIQFISPLPQLHYSVNVFSCHWPRDIPDIISNMIVFNFYSRKRKLVHKKKSNNAWKLPAPLLLTSLAPPQK